MLGYTAHDVDALAWEDFAGLCDALDRYEAKERAAAAELSAQVDRMGGE